MRVNNWLLLGLLFLSITSQAQLGGSTSYQFLNLVSSARQASLGGNQISVKDDDLTLAIFNPSLLNDSMSSDVAMSYVNYFADVNYGFASYAKHFDSVGTFAATVQFLDYGSFTAADETGVQTGQFSAGDYALTIGYGSAIDSLFSLGANFKVIYSNFEQYNSFAVAIDLAGTYHNPKRRLTAAAVMKNIGTQIDPFVEGNSEKLPFELQAGITHVLKYAPLRVGLVAENLQKWDLTFDNPTAGQDEIDPLTGEVIPRKEPGFGDKLMRHVVLNTEVLLSKNFQLRFGFNYRRRQELKLIDRPGLTGFSAGLGFKIKKFHLSYGRSSYNRAGVSNHFTVTTRLADFGSRNWSFSLFLKAQVNLFNRRLWENSTLP